MLMLGSKISSDSIPKAGGQIGIKIPDSVLIDLFFVYENGTEDMLGCLPSDFICDGNGNFWTTWKRIFEIRSQMHKWKHKKILFRKFGK